MDASYHRNDVLSTVIGYRLPLSLWVNDEYIFGDALPSECERFLTNIDALNMI